MTQRERRLAIMTGCVLGVGLLYAVVLRPLGEMRAEALEQLPKGERELSQIQNLVVQRSLLERDIEKLTASMGNPKSDLVQPKDRFEAQKNLTEQLQNMGWEKPYSISPGPLEEGKHYDTIVYDVEGRCDWGRLLQTLGDLEWNESLARAHDIRVNTGDGKPRVSMRVTLYIAKRDKPERMEEKGEGGADKNPAPDPS